MSNTYIDPHYRQLQLNLLFLIGIDGECGVAPTQYSAEVLTGSALGVIEKALWDSQPSARYELRVPNSKFRLKCPCRLIPAPRRVLKV